MKQRRIIHHDWNVKLRRKYRSVIIMICPHHLISNRTIDMYFGSKIFKWCSIEKHSHPFILTVIKMLSNHNHIHWMHKWLIYISCSFIFFWNAALWRKEFLCTFSCYIQLSSYSIIIHKFEKLNRQNAFLPTTFDKFGVDSATEMYLFSNGHRCSACWWPYLDHSCRLAI